MKISSANFVAGVVSESPILSDGTPHVAFIGRSNVGKSSMINALTSKKDLARTSAFPGRTQQINVFLINQKVYLLDLPGYGFAKASAQARERLGQLIDWYLFESPYEQRRVVQIIDANIGPTESDLAMLRALDDYNKEVLIIANKIDKIKKSIYHKQMKMIQDTLGGHKIIPFSTETKSGIEQLRAEIFQ